MNKFALAASAAVLSLHSLGAFAIPLDNLGFESGLSGYTYAGGVTTVSSATAYHGTVYTATEGNSFAKLIATSANTNNVGGTTGAYIKSTGELNAGDSISFDWAFLAFDYLPFNDFALFVAGEKYLLSDVATVGNYGDSGWQTFTWVAPSHVLGNFYIGVSNVIDSGSASMLLVDNLSLRYANAPESATIALFGLGLVGLGLARRNSAAAKSA